MSESLPERASALALKDIRHQYRQGDSLLEVLRGGELEIEPGEVVGLVGPSGSGKSTLLHIAGLLERPAEGEIYISGRGCCRLPEKRRTRLRRESIGFVYQYHYLLPDFSALENVLIPQMINSRADKKARERAQWLLGRMGLSERLSHRPSQLSGGEQQRVAIARALANRPRLLLADEPTGNLDPATSNAVFDELIRLVRDTGLSALIGTHNTELAARMDRQVTIDEGYITPTRMERPRSARDFMSGRFRV